MLLASYPLTIISKHFGYRNMTNEPAYVCHRLGLRSLRGITASTDSNGDYFRRRRFDGERFSISSLTQVNAAMVVGKPKVVNPRRTAW